MSTVVQQFRREMRDSVSSRIVVACVALFLGLKLLGLIHLFSWQQAVSVLGLSRSGILDHCWLFQFLTSLFLHANLMHLVFNMLTLWMLGPSLERTMGLRRYVKLSVISALCGMIGFLLTNPHPFVITMGYSSVIFGILVAQAIHFPDGRLVIFALFPMKMKHAVLLIGAIELYLTVTPDGGRGVAHAAHLFGALGALVYLRCPTWMRGQVKKCIVNFNAAFRRKARVNGKRTEIPTEL